MYIYMYIYFVFAHTSHMDRDSNIDKDIQGIGFSAGTRKA